MTLREFLESRENHCVYLTVISQMPEHSFMFKCNGYSDSLLNDCLTPLVLNSIVKDKLTNDRLSIIQSHISKKETEK